MKRPEDRIFDRLVEIAGEEAQIQMAAGECGEFLTLLGRRVQGRATDADWIDEIADVTIMMRQMRKLFGKKEVDARIRFKMTKLEKIVFPQPKEQP